MTPDKFVRGENPLWNPDALIMRLIGSKTEIDFRMQLEHSHKFHFSDSSNSNLKYALVEKGHKVDRAYVLHWIPEQHEDIFLVLVDGNVLVHIELEKESCVSILDYEIQDIKSYTRGLSRVNQVKLAVAQDLAST